MPALHVGCPSALPAEEVYTSQTNIYGIRRKWSMQTVAPSRRLEDLEPMKEKTIIEDATIEAQLVEVIERCDPGSNNLLAQIGHYIDGMLGRVEASALRAVTARVFPKYDVSAKAVLGEIELIARQCGAPPVEIQTHLSRLKPALPPAW